MDLRPQKKLSAIFQGVGYIGLIAAAVVEFIPAMVLLGAQVFVVPWAMWLTLLVPVVVMAMLLPRASGSQRVWIMNAGGLSVLILQTIIDQPAGPAWFPFNFAAFAVGFGAAFSLPAAPALIVIFCAGILNLIVVINPTGQVLLLASDLAGGLVGPAIVLIVCGSFVGVAQGWRRMASESDRRAFEIERATEAAYQAAHVQSAKTAIERRIHETILNTLNAINHGWDFESVILRRECRRDVEQLDLGRLSPAPVSLLRLIEEARAAVVFDNVLTQLDVGSDVDLSPHVAASLRDALVEVLRNVDRHAHASHCVIEAHVSDDTATIRVADDGVGFTHGAQERFGLRNTIRASIGAVGGTTDVFDQTGTGSVIQIVVPFGDPLELKLPAEPGLDILLQPLKTRLFLLGGAAFGLAMLPWLAGPFGNRAPSFIIAFCIFVATSICLALVWNQRWRTIATLAVVIATIALYVTTQQSITSCESASSIHWMINSVGSCLGLVLFAAARLKLNWLMLPLMVGMGVWLMVTLPAQCQSLIVMPLFATTTYLASAMYLISVLLKASDRQRQRALTSWTAATAKRVEVAKQREATAQWNRVSAGTRALLLGIAEGQLDPRDPIVRARAAREEGQLRANLGIRGTTDSLIWTDLLGVVDRAAEIGLHVDLDVIEFPRSDRQLSEGAVEILEEVVAASGGNPVTIRLFVDRGIPEIVCTCRQATAAQVWTSHIGPVDLDSMPNHAILEPGTTVSLEYMEEGLACVSVRQQP
jgi:signal transduction histidine kinase